MVMNEDNKEEAVPFLIYDLHTRVFTLTEQGEDVIRNLNSSFGVISVAGMYRTGKSYLLNRMLLNRQKGFSVGPTVNPCTKGLWIWSKPIYGSSEDGTRLPVLLIDTEGFGAFDEDQNHDIRIFTLSILLSSYFVYNSLGSIDENALQSLNFVINLSKHIQLKTNQAYSEADPEELANLFPSFLWVLRDFSLQLVDEDGESITAKEYLEKVLEVTKAFADQEQKNKIRKLIKTYFKDRDCFTMVRPLTKEKDLQSLENLGPDKLRPEFLEQILQLRKKILSRVKVKTFKGKPLNSEMYLNLIKSLITSINSGRIPNIESTWISMCKVESYKAFEDSERLYENILRETFDSGSVNPNDESLRNVHTEAKEKCMELFKKRALGDVAGEYLKQLKAKLKEKFSYYSKLQEEDLKGKILRVLNKWYSIIECRVQGGELKSVEDIEIDFKSMEYKLNETFPAFSLRNELFNDFKSKVLLFAGDFFANKLQNEMKLTKNENSQVIFKLTNDLNDVKVTFEKEVGKRNEIIERNKQEMNDLKDQLSTIKESLAVSEKDKDIQAKNLNSQILRVKEEYERKINEISSKMLATEDKQKEAERRAITTKADCEREKALLDQRIEHLGKLIEDFSKREKESGMEMKSQLKEQAIAFKEKSEKYEQAIKNLTTQNDAYKEKIVDIESNLSNFEHMYQNEKLKADELQAKLSSDTKEMTEKISLLKKQLSEDKSKYIEEYKTKEGDLNSKMGKLKLRVEELELHLKNSEDNSKSITAKLERENAILKQENGFLKAQNEELTESLDDQKKNYENIIATLENKTFSMVGHEEFQKKVDEIKLYFESEKKQNEESFEKAKLIYVSQIDKLTEKMNEAEFKNKLYREDTERELNEYKSKNDKLSKDYGNLINEKKILNENLINTNDEANSKIRSTLEEMERKLEDKEKTHQNELCEMNKTSEDTISQMKALFETEKIRFEEKLKEEKLKNDRKIKYTIEDYENKIREIEAELNEEKEELQNQYNDLDARHANLASTRENEMQVLHQRIESLEDEIKESKESLTDLQTQANFNIEQATESFNKERKDLQSKIDMITNDMNNKEKEIASIQMKRDQMEKIIAEKDGIINSMRKEYTDERNEILSKLEMYKSKYSESSDEFMIKKLDYTRENALLKQQIEFLNKKIEESGKIAEDNQKKYEDRLFGLRAEVERDLNEKFDRMKKEKEDLEGKLLSKKKEIKELEQTFTKTNKQLEKERSEITEKNFANERKVQEITEIYERETAMLNKTVKTLTEENMSMKENLMSGSDATKKRIAVLEMELSEKNVAYEKEQILWEGKIKFVEQQRDTLKKDLAEASKRFENLLENIQKKGNLEKEKIENSTQNAISALEQKYQTQIKELQENHSKLYTELLSNNRELDRELKSLTMQNEINKGKAIDPSLLNKKMEEYTEEKDKLKSQIEEIKKEKEAKLVEWHAIAEKEKEGLKSKISEVESKLRETESKRGFILFEFEKERAKWDLEKTHLESKASELQEAVERIEKKNETLLRENEKLKNDKNNMKRSTSTKASQQAMNNYSMINTNTSLLGGPNTSIIGGIGAKDTAVGLIGNVNPPIQTKFSTGSSMYGKEMNKILGDTSTSILSGVDMNTSKLVDRSFDKYDSSKYDNPYSGKIGNSKYGIKPVILGKKEEENGNSLEGSPNNLQTSSKK